jgi:hypothetical protein
MRDDFQNKADEYARQAIEQEQEALNNKEEIPYSAELTKLIERYRNQSVADVTYYDEVRMVNVTLLNKSQPVSGIQVMAITGDDVTIYETTDLNGTAQIRWTSEVDFVRAIRIGNLELKGNRWLDGSSIKVDLEDFVVSNLKNINENGYWNSRLSLSKKNITIS